jgi:uncharacterized protein YidB (DUF937 family)
MGLLDILNGMQNGPRGEKQPGSGGMSPLTMAMIALLAYKALKNFGGAQTQPQTGPAGSPRLPQGNQLPGTQASADDGLGGLGGLLKGGLGGLGGLLAGGAAGSVLSGGLNDLLKQFEQTGHGDVAKSWVGTGPNQRISESDLEHALGDDTVNSLAEQAGLSRVELLSGLSQHLPGFVDQLTPRGSIPDEDEMSRLV